MAAATAPASGWGGAAGARVRVGGPQPGEWVHSPFGSYRVGYARPGVPGAPGQNQDPQQNLGWQPPPIPAGTYNPIRDIELAEGKRGSEQELTGLDRQRTNAENTYATNLGLLGQREGQHQMDAKQAIERIIESFTKLGARQGEQANVRGVLNGGTMLAAAGKRAANEQLSRRQADQAAARQRQADENERGRLATQQSQLTGPGGSLTEAIQNARANQQAFAGSVGTLKGTEAAQHGYVPPQRPWTKTRLGSVRVGGRY